MPAHTLPAQERQRDKCLFELARWVKEHWPDATRDELRVIVHEWHERALPVIGTKDFGTSWADFLTGWEKVRQPYGATETFEQIVGQGTTADSSPQTVGMSMWGHCAHTACELLGYVRG